MKIRHTLLMLLAILAIAFMQPLVFFVGGLTLLLIASAFIFRDLPPAAQDAVERYILGWLLRARSNPTLEIEPSAARCPPAARTPAGPSPQKSEQIRRVHAKTTAAAIQSDPALDIAPDLPARNKTTPSATSRYKKPPPAP
ncbi:MAG TPA: hypothetical protein P5149_12985 [Candidatus Competibacteraceae bacterium]|nr:hypothetical protein [Candidatus Competibacteraceae bacterium]MCP5132732.1 hypothetical protein [Gammaproteobacteria bacterium]HPF58750.1 hypothetical protein [Candidatus Competibacteraceae bacterium]HRY19304.1 hypothetical protein [Candidatus Competibacteraceae bacterium]